MNTERIIHTEEINTLIENQLQEWPMAKANFDALVKARRKRVAVGDLETGVQFNPARIRSTGADISKEAIAARKCFLCRENRPAEQHTHNLMSGLEMLVNPFPIFPVHFTFPAKEHRPQTAPPPAMALLAIKFPDLCIFYNGAKAGASAPDHLHLQGVLSRELPLIRLVERSHPAEGKSLMWSEEFGKDLPFRFLSGIVNPEETNMETLRTLLTTFGHDKEGAPDAALVNTYFWIDPACGLLRGIAIPRRAHRPSCYTAEATDRLIVSPGAIDMAGMIITPREGDFEKITSEDIRRIYREVAFESQTSI